MPFHRETMSSRKRFVFVVVSDVLLPLTSEWLVQQQTGSKHGVLSGTFALSKLSVSI